jgi:hypothetical protein
LTLDGAILESRTLVNIFMSLYYLGSDAGKPFLFSDIDGNA